MIHVHYFLQVPKIVYPLLARGCRCLYSPSCREGSFSEVGGSKPLDQIRHIANRAVSPWDPAAFCRGIATPAARIRYEELQVVADQLRENYSCVALYVLRGR